MKVPNFFIIGAAKAGTTTLHNYMDSHPDVYMSPIKEPHYFCKDLFLDARSSGRGGNVTYEGQALRKYLQREKKKKIHGAIINEWEDYLKLFDNVSNEKMVGEASPSYLESKIAATEIKAVAPDARVVTILRNPVRRAFSHYLMDLRNNKINCSFLEALEQNTYLIEAGMYYEHLTRYFTVFGPEKIRIYLSEDLKDDPKTLIMDLSRFLGVSERFTPLGDDQNTASVPRFAFINAFLNRHQRVNNAMKKAFALHTPSSMQKALRLFFLHDKELPDMSEREISFLLNIYTEDIHKLSSLIDRDLSSWLKME